MNNTSEFQQIMDKLEEIGAMVEKLTAKRDSFKSAELMDSTDMCNMLGVTKRTLDRYKQKGLLPYHKISGVTYYMPAEVQESLKKIHRVNNLKIK